MAVSLDELVSMAVFARVVQERSFTAAAPHLGLSKSVVSERVSQLEARLGTRLLLRTTRKLSLTPEGERLYERFQHVLTAADAAAEAAHAVGNRIAGTLRITAPVYLGHSYLTDWLAEFTLRHAGISVELSLSDRMDDLVAGAYDVGIRVSARLPDSSIVARLIGTDVRLPVASPDYVARRGLPSKPQDLGSHDCLRLEGIADEWWFSHEGQVVRARVTGSLVSNSIAALRVAALRGLGITVMLRSLITEDLAAGTLVPIPLECARAELAIHLVAPHHDVVPAKVRALGDFLSTKMAALDARTSARKRPKRAR